MANLSIGRKIAVAVLITVFGVFLGVAFNMNSIVAAYQQGRDQAFYTSMHDSCIVSATQSATASGAAAAAIKPKIDAYCGCLVDEAHSKIPPDVAASLDLTSDAGRAKLTELAQFCVAKVTQ